jgi:hypothetical protein
MTNPWEGFWQVVYDDPRDEIVPRDELYTTISLRRSGFSVYAGGRFLHIRAESGRRPPSGWPPTDAERIAWARTASSAAGTCAWRSVDGGWVGEHEISMAPDPRDTGSSSTLRATIDGTQADVVIESGGAPTRETWRRLSGPGSSPLAGAWGATGERDRWMFLVTEGHYGVVRQDLERRMPAAGEALGDDELLRISDGFGSNAGAIVVTATSFDNHPFLSSNAAGYEALKHPTFKIVSADEERIVIGLRADGSDASPWGRLG